MLLGPATRYFGAVYYLYNVIKPGTIDTDTTWILTLDDDMKYNKHGIQVIVTQFLYFYVCEIVFSCQQFIFLFADIFRYYK